MFFRLNNNNNVKQNTVLDDEIDVLINKMLVMKELLVASMYSEGVFSKWINGQVSINEQYKLTDEEVAILDRFSRDMQAILAPEGLADQTQIERLNDKIQEKEIEIKRVQAEISRVKASDNQDKTDINELKKQAQHLADELRMMDREISKEKWKSSKFNQYSDAILGYKTERGKRKGLSDDDTTFLKQLLRADENADLKTFLSENIDQLRSIANKFQNYVANTVKSSGTEELYEKYYQSSINSLHKIFQDLQKCAMHGHGKSMKLLASLLEPLQEQGIIQEDDLKISKNQLMTYVNTMDPEKQRQIKNKIGKSKLERIYELAYELCNNKLYDAAFLKLHESAEKGHLKSLILLGTLLTKGLGCNKDLNVASKVFLIAYSLTNDPKLKEKIIAHMKEVYEILKTNNENSIGNESLNYVNSLITKVAQGIVKSENEMIDQNSFYRLGEAQIMRYKLRCELGESPASAGSDLDRACGYFESALKQWDADKELKRAIYEQLESCNQLLEGVEEPIITHLNKIYDKIRGYDYRI